MILDTNNHHSIFSKQYLSSWSYLLRFEIISFIGRIFFQRYPPKINEKQFLNLGCGLSYFDDWVNADFFRVRFWKVPKNGWSLDFRYPLKCKDNYFEGIYTEHTIEHLHHYDDFNMFKELFRVLKPGCWLRISVPGLDKVLEQYSDGTKIETQGEILYETKAEAIWSLTQNWGHLSVWDFKLLSYLLAKAGFQNISEVSYLKGTDRRFLKDEPGRKH